MSNTPPFKEAWAHDFAPPIHSLDRHGDFAPPLLALGLAAGFFGVVNTGNDTGGLTTLNAIVDGIGAVISAGVKGDVTIGFPCRITSVVLLADQVGSIVVDIWKDTYANYPPTVADTITSSTKPTLSSAASYRDAALSGWTTGIHAGDTLRFNIDSAAVVTRVCVALNLTKT